jgi:hypothetical protein
LRVGWLPDCEVPGAIRAGRCAITGQMCGEQADARSCGHCGAATDQETPVDVAETVALPVPETSDQEISEG